MFVERNRTTGWIAIISILLLLTTSLALLSAQGRASGSVPKVVVSLTWDDGRASQIDSLPIQEAHGMHATYYINSGNIGSSGYYLTKTQLDRVALAGNEIGGHTELHQNLTTIPLVDATAAICTDRNRLVSWYGPDAGRSFAYPYGASNADVRTIPGQCGYESARGVTGVRTPTACLGCRLAESLPPADKWQLAGPTSVTSSATLADLTFQIDQASANGGGWVIFAFHSIGTSSDIYGIDPVLYDSFLGWLGARADVEVRTVGDVMSTTWPGPTTTTTSPAPPPPSSSPVPMRNAGLEDDSNGDGTADCWLRGRSGTNTAVWNRVSDAHGGTAADEVTISSFTSGDRKLVQVLDGGTASGGCAPSVDASNTYTLNLWYRSTGSSNFVVFIRDGTGTWKYWRTGPIIAPSTNWAAATFNPGLLPAGTTALSYGLALVTSGNLAVDDFSMSSTPTVTPPINDALVKNSSFESDSNADGIADCWFRGGYGTSTYSFQRVPDAHSGSWGQKLSISSLSTGDRKIVQPLDSGQSAGGCAIDVTAGNQYWLRTWYHSDASPLLFLYLRDSQGLWRWWLSTFPYAPSASWTQASFLTPPLPAGTTAISFGLGLTGVGTLVIDDASVAGF